ncbi:MAG TPA: hypothetical protein VHS58_20605 [Acetobacteraceae bacterium]|nr:hypothetical protein [Acetobacteraceae bacterium]
MLDDADAHCFPDADRTCAVHRDRSASAASVGRISAAPCASFDPTLRCVPLITYKGRSVDAKRIGQELDVYYVFQGSVRAIDCVLRISVELVSVETNEHLWAERFDVSPDAIDDVARTIMTTVRYRLIEAENARSAREHPANSEFIDIIFMLRGYCNQQVLAPNPQNRAEVISLFEHAAQLDPASVLAHAGAAEALLDTIIRTPRQWSAERKNSCAGQRS